MISFLLKKSPFSPPQISLIYIQMKLESRSWCHDQHFRSFSPTCQISFPIGIGPTVRIINFTRIGLEYRNHWPSHYTSTDRFCWIARLDQFDHGSLFYQSGIQLVTQYIVLSILDLRSERPWVRFVTLGQQVGLSM